MEKIQSWLNDFKSFFSSEVAKISSAQAELSTVSAELATAKSTIAAHEATIADLNGKLQAAQDLANTHGAKVASLTTELEAEKAKTTESLSAQGLDANKLPEAGNGTGALTTQQQIDAIRSKIASSTDPKEKSKLSRQIKELIAGSKN
jgi:DNA repair ATPase RecN